MLFVLIREPPRLHDHSKSNRTHRIPSPHVTFLVPFHRPTSYHMFSSRSSPSHSTNRPTHSTIRHSKHLCHSAFIPSYAIPSNPFRVCVCNFLFHPNPFQDVMEEYRRTGRHTNHGMELVVEMLTTGYWPTQTSPKCRLPPQPVKCCDDFVEFYLQKHTVSLTMFPFL